MKLRPRTYRIEWDLHAWLGLSASLILFVIFFCGVFALFEGELALWQEPPLRTPAAMAGQRVSLQEVFEAFEGEQRVPRGDHVAFQLVEGSRLVHVDSHGDESDGAPPREAHLDALTLAELPEGGSRLGEELYRLHFLDQIPYGPEVAGFAAVALIVLVISGLMIHLKNLPRHLLRLRPRLNLRHFGADLHNLLGTLTLPFPAILGWSGALLCLGGLFDSGLSSLALDDAQDLEKLRWGESYSLEASGVAGPLLDLDVLVDKSRAALGTTKTPTYIELTHPRDANGTLLAYFPTHAFEPYEFVVLSAVDGRVLGQTDPAAMTPIAWFELILHGLHFASFESLLLRFTWAVLSLCMCAVIVLGNVIWLERRDPRRTKPSSPYIERLTIGVPGGLCIGVAVYFLANRVLPWDLAERANWELGIFLATWLCVTLGAFVVRATLARSAFVLAASSTALYAAVTCASVAQGGAHLFNALALGQRQVFVCELLVLLMIAMCASVTWLVRPRVASRAATAAPALGAEDVADS